MKMKYVFFLLNFLILFTTCEKEEINKIGKVEYKDGIITCEWCNRFGGVIRIVNDDLFIASKREVFYFTRVQSDWKFKQMLEMNEDVDNIHVEDGLLYIGTLYLGPRSGYIIYEKLNDSWVEVQILQLPNSFGNYIDIDGKHLIVTQNQMSGTVGNSSDPDLGRILFYERENGLWKLTQFFHAEVSSNIKELGGPVALQYPYAYAACALYNSFERCGEGLHVYRHNGQEWVFETFMSPINNGFTLDGRNIITGNFLHSQPYQAYEFEGYSVLKEYPLMVNFSTNERTYHGQKVQLHGNQLAIGFENTGISSIGSVFLLELDGNEWIVKQRFEAPADANRAYGYSFDFSEDWMVIGEANYGLGYKVYVYHI